MANSSTPKSLRRIISCALLLIQRQGFSRRHAIAAAISIIEKAGDKSPASTRPLNAARSEAALEYLQHRNRTMSIRSI